MTEMTEQWGPPLTGEQMKALRDAGFPENTGFWSIACDGGITMPTCSFLSNGYRLPADHIAYTLLEKGWLDIPNVRLWFGGNEAPDDWLEGSDVLFRRGEVPLPSKSWSWRHWGVGGDIIAYIRKAEHREETVKACQSFDDTVTIAKMTEAEWSQRFGFGGAYDVAAKLVLDQLGLIKQEPTREERFWAQREPEGTTVSTHIKKWVKEALEFERD